MGKKVLAGDLAIIIQRRQTVFSTRRISFESRSHVQKTREIDIQRNLLKQKNVKKRPLEASENFLHLKNPNYFLILHNLKV